MAEFKVVSDFDLMGDQPEAVDTLAKGILNGKRAQTLMGVTGSGKTFTMAKLIEGYRNRHWSFRIIKRWLHSFMANSRSSFRRTQWNTLSPTMIITSLKRTWLPPIRISRKILI